MSKKRSAKANAEVCSAKISTTISCGLLLLASQLVGSLAFALPVRLGLGPDNNHQLLLSTIASAKRELVINIYQFESAEIAGAIMDRIQQGVSTAVLVEGDPFGQMSSAGKKVLATLASAMTEAKSGDHHLYVMGRRPLDGKRRFRWNHAKYVVVDGERSLISSENFSPNGHMKKGYVGNRGWEAAMESDSIASQLKALFRSDTDLSFGDVEELRGAAVSTPIEMTQKLKVRKTRAIPEGQAEATGATLLTSPDSLSGLLELIRSAKSNIDVEQMSLPSLWRSPTRAQSPIVTELIRAAQRGVRVRVLLNDDSVFARQSAEEARAKADQPSTSPKRPNEITVDLLQAAASAENLPLEARIVDVDKVEITYIHNKGFIVDGERALVSSINGSQNSVMNNREVAVLLESTEAATYFENAFAFDWQRSAKGPVAAIRAAQTLMGELFLSAEVAP